MSILLEPKLTPFFLKLLLVVVFYDSNRKGTESSLFSRKVGRYPPHCVLALSLSFTPLLCYYDYLSASHPITAATLSPGLTPPSEPLIGVDSSYHLLGPQVPGTRAGGRPVGSSWLTPYPNMNCSVTHFCPHGLTSLSLPALSHPALQSHQITSSLWGTHVL